MTKIINNVSAIFNTVFGGWVGGDAAACTLMWHFLGMQLLHILGRGHAVAQLVEALRYKREGHGFDS